MTAAGAAGALGLYLGIVIDGLFIDGRRETGVRFCSALWQPLQKPELVEKLAVRKDYATA
jgi:hypothetical protein